LSDIELIGLSCLSEAFQSEDVTFDRSKSVGTLELKANTGKDKHSLD